MNLYFPLAVPLTGTPSTRIFLPDAIGEMLTTLIARVDRLERPRVAEEPPPHTPAPDAEGIWRGEDFQI